MDSQPNKKQVAYPLSFGDIDLPCHVCNELGVVHHTYDESGKDDKNNTCPACLGLGVLCLISNQP